MKMNMRMNTNNFPLSLAARDGHVAIVEVLLAHGSVYLNQASSEFGGTALYMSCTHGTSTICGILLRQDGIEVNRARTGGGATPLYAACSSGHTEVVKMLLAHDGIEVNKVRSDDGAALLYTACNLGHTDAVRTLLADERANIEKVSQDGEPPLHTSAWSGHLLCAQLLIIHGASLSAKNNTDETAAESAITDNQPILAEWLTAVTGWSHLRVAAGCRLYKDAAVALRLGRMDPDADDSPQPAAMVQELMAAIATSKAAPAALPWQDAPPICKDTIKLVVAATRGWSRATHGLHHGKV